MKEIDERPIKLALYIIETKHTIRKTANKFSISKSSVHNDISNRLKYINYNLYQQTQKILKINFNQKHIRGGLSTKNKYLKINKKKK